MGRRYTARVEITKVDGHIPATAGLSVAAAAGTEMEGAAGSEVAEEEEGSAAAEEVEIGVEEAVVEVTRGEVVEVGIAAEEAAGGDYTHPRAKFLLHLWPHPYITDIMADIIHSPYVHTAPLLLSPPAGMKLPKLILGGRGNLIRGRGTGAVY